MTMPAHCSHQPISERTKSCLEWDEYDEAAYEMWEMAGTRDVSIYILRVMADRLRELLPPKL